MKTISKVQMATTLGGDAGYVALDAEECVYTLGVMQASMGVNNMVFAGAFMHFHTGGCGTTLNNLA